METIVLLSTLHVSFQKCIALAKDFRFSKDKGFGVPSPWKIASYDPRAFKNNNISILCVIEVNSGKTILGIKTGFSGICGRPRGVEW